MSAVSRIARTARVIRPRVAVQARALTTSVRPVARVASVAASPAIALPAQRRWASKAAAPPTKLDIKLTDADKKKLARQRNIGM